MSIKLITSYSLSTGVVQFADGSKKKFKQESIAVIDKMFYMLASRDANFDNSIPDLSSEVGVDIAFDLLENHKRRR